MEQSWKQAKAVFAGAMGPPLFWLVLFFLVPLGIVWVYSFGQNAGLTEISFTGTFSNYARAIEPLYLKIFAKSAWVAALTTFLCLVLGFPVALAITFAPTRLKAWLLLLVMLPFWTNLLIRTYALIAVLRTEGYINLSLGWLWEPYFPVIKKIWSSSFVLVAGGWSAIILGVFYGLIDGLANTRLATPLLGSEAERAQHGGMYPGRAIAWLATPFIWVGANPIFLYLPSGLGFFHKITNSIVGHPAAGWTWLASVVNFLLMLLTARWLYKQRVFIRI